MPGSQVTRCAVGWESLAYSGMGAAGARARAVGAWVRWAGWRRRLESWWTECGRRLWARRAGYCGCLGAWCSTPAFAPSKAGCVRLWVCLRAKNDVRLRFNSESGSSLKSRRPSTCGFVNVSCPDTEPARFKTQTCRFFLGTPGPRGCKPRLEAKKSARREGFSNRVGRLGFGAVTPGAKRAPVAPCARSQWTGSLRRVEASPIASGAGRCGRAF